MCVCVVDISTTTLYIYWLWTNSYPYRFGSTPDVLRRSRRYGWSCNTASIFSCPHCADTKKNTPAKNLEIYMKYINRNIQKLSESSQMSDPPGTPFSILFRDTRPIDKCSESRALSAEKRSFSSWHAALSKENWSICCCMLASEGTCQWMCHAWRKLRKYKVKYRLYVGYHSVSLPLQFHSEGRKIRTTLLPKPWIFSHCYPSFPIMLLLSSWHMQNVSRSKT